MSNFDDFKLTRRAFAAGTLATATFGTGALAQTDPAFEEALANEAAR